MKRPVLAAAALVVASTFFWLGAQTHAAPSPGETSVSRLVHDYIATLAAQNGFTVQYEKVLAYRVDGDKSVARVQLRVLLTDLDPYTGKKVSQVRAVTLVFRFARSPWQMTEQKVAQ